MQHNIFPTRFLKWMKLVILVSIAICFVRLFSNTTSFENPNPPFAEHMRSSFWKIITSAGDGQTLKVTPNTKKGRNEKFMKSCRQRTPPESRAHRLDVQNRTSWTMLSQVTDARKTTVQLMESKGKLKICDQIQVRIETRDALGNTKTYGGDFIRIKMFSEETRSYLNPDYMVDNGNGTYDAYFTLRWSGPAHIDAMLVHSSEAVSVINRFIQTMPNRLSYEAIYKHPETEQEEVTHCNVINLQKESCNYSDPRIFAPWYCEKPAKPYLKCSHIHKICHNDPRAKRKVTGKTTTLEREALDMIKMPIGDDLVSFNVSDEENVFQKPLQFCQLTKTPTDMSSQGYFLNDTWHPFHCEIKSFSVEETLICLKDTHIYMFGDSTMRQFNEYFLNHLNGFKPILKQREGFPLSPSHAHNVAFNVTLKFRCHGPPLKTPCVPMEETRYVFNELDKLQGGPNVIILISLWAHFEKTSLYLYEKRIEATLDSVERLLERYPQTTVIFKGANTRQVKDFFWTICSSDWVAYRFEEKLRSVLSRRNLNFGFLDAWDLTTSHYSPDFIHPNGHIVGTMVNQVLTHYCK